MYTIPNNLRRYVLKYICFITFIFPLNFTANSQQKPEDSLLRLVDDVQTNDTIRVLAYCDLSLHYNFSSPVKAGDYLNKAYKLSLDKEFLHGKALTLLRLGVLNYEQGNIKEGLEFWFKSIDGYKKLGKHPQAYYQEISINGIIDNLTWIARSYCGIGEMENFEKHLKEVKSLLKKKNTEFSRIAWVTIEWAGCYFSNGKYKEALKQFETAYDYFKKIKDPYGMSNTLANIAMVHQRLGNINMAMDFLTRSLEGYKKVSSIDGMHWVYNIIGNIYSEMHNFDSAIVNYEKGMILAQENKQDQSLLSSYLNIGRLYEKTGNVSDGLPYWVKAYNIASKYRLPEYILITGIYLAQYHELMGELDISLKYFKQYIRIKDSIDDSENMKSIGKMEAKYDFDKKQIIQEKKHQEELQSQNAIAAAEKQKQWFIIIGVLFGLLVVFVFSVVIYRRNILTRRQNKIIELQKKEVEQKNKEILDSINYAKRIQAAVLPSPEMINHHLPENFILYQPKDIVAGDFYWLESIPNSSSTNSKTIMFAVCDCTGHGVPGAMVSVICNNGLNRSVREHKLTNPGKILEKTRQIVVQEFEKSGTDVNDGMDVALVSIESNDTNTILNYSGANNPIWIIRRNSNSIEEFKPTKQHIGKFDNVQPFITHQITIHKGDMVYLFTDGYKDQFGYDETKKKSKKEEKFKSYRLRNLLLSIHNLPMEEQKNALLKSFDKWRNDLEQVDDICFVGFRI